MKMKAGWLRVKEVVNYSITDELNGKELVDGEQLELKYPDGTTEKKRVMVCKGSRNVPEQGHLHGFDYSTSKAYIFTEVHGASVKVRLARTDIKARRIK